MDLLEWSIGTLDRETTEAQWHFLVPPILKMMDDVDVEWKANGCHLLGLLLERLRQSPARHLSGERPKTLQSSPNFLQRTGYHNVFAESLLPLFTYVPSLTPEQDSVLLFTSGFSAITSLALLLPVENGEGNDRYRFLDKVFRDSVLYPLAHFPTPSTYPELATAIVAHMPDMLGHMGIESVKHLPNLIPLLSTILREPFALSHKSLVVTTLQALQSVVLNAWPRLPEHRGEVMMGLCLLWARCMQTKAGVEEVDEVKKEVKETVCMLDAVMRAGEAEGLGQEWEREKRDVAQAAAGFGELFEACV